MMSLIKAQCCKKKLSSVWNVYESVVFVRSGQFRPTATNLIPLSKYGLLDSKRTIISTTDWEAVKTKPKFQIRRVTVMSLMLLMPIISFGLGYWQIKRLKWKTDLIAEYENRLILPPLILPPEVNPEVAATMQYRRVIAKGKFLHDKEILVGPRLYEGENGYNVITPLQRENGTTILVNRGWIRKDMADRRKRNPKALPTEATYVEGLIKLPANRNYFTPDNEPEKGLFFFVDVPEFAKMTGSQPVIIEELDTQYTEADTFSTWEVLAMAGIPIGRPPRIDLKNNHAQYIATWFGVCLATSIMFVIMWRAPKTEKANKLKHLKYYS
ncbi:SURF1 family-domain-containing protein [Lipomyces arxii]|uniref:SURF1 family-domain-containing protein n=1 Tax=Lipomyces arxii TaxID=56418 RepID=UPI0034CF3D21